MTDDLLYLSDRHERNKNPKDDSWKKGPKITLKDCINGTGKMEKTTAKEMFASKSGPEDEMKFGKYKNRKLVWVRDNDPGYWNWAIENVPNFDKIAKNVK